MVSLSQSQAFWLTSLLSKLRKIKHLYRWVGGIGLSTQLQGTAFQQSFSLSFVNLFHLALELIQGKSQYLAGRDCSRKFSVCLCVHIEHRKGALIPILHGLPTVYLDENIKLFYVRRKKKPLASWLSPVCCFWCSAPVTTNSWELNNAFQSLKNEKRKEKLWRLYVIIVIACCKLLHDATSLSESCSYLHCIIHFTIKTKQRRKNPSKIYEILVGMDFPISKTKVIYANRKSACQKKTFPFTACVRQEIVKVVAEKWAWCTHARLWLELWQRVWQQLQHSFMLGEHELSFHRFTFWRRCLRGSWGFLGQTRSA